MHFHQNVGFIDNSDRASILIDNWKLRHIRAAHSLERSQQRIARSDGNDFARFVAMTDQIAQDPRAARR